MSEKFKVLIVSSQRTDNFAMDELNLEVQLANSVKSGEFLLHEWQPHILILDNNESTDLSGFFRLRQSYPHKNLKIIFIDHIYSIEQERSCFEHQFSFYLLSPENEQVKIRVEALCHLLSRKKLSPVLTYKNLTLNTLSKEVMENKLKLKISPVHFKLLQVFLDKENQIVSREELLNRVWINKKCSKRSVDAQVSKLKKCFPQLEIENIYGEGYRLKSAKSTDLKIAS